MVYLSDKEQGLLKGTGYGTAANHYVRALYDTANMKGLNGDGLIARCGIPPSVLTHPELRVPTEKLAQFQMLVWQTLDDESNGMSNKPMPVGSYYMMGKLTVHQPTLRKALELGVQFYNLLIHKNFIRLEQEGTQTTLAFAPQQPALDYKHLFAEMCLLAWHRYASWLISDVLPLTETRFPYAAPKHIGEYHYLYPGVHKFSSHQLALVFPSHYLERTVKQSEGSLKTFMARCPLELFRQYKADYSLASELKLILTKSIMSGASSIEDCSEKLHMTTRTMMRKLKEEGTSFQQIKDIVRRDRAIYLLSQPTMRINEVAEKVGFSDPSVFTRAFRSWTGRSPRNFRQSMKDTPK